MRDRIPNFVALTWLKDSLSDRDHNRRMKRHLKKYPTARECYMGNRIMIIDDIHRDWPDQIYPDATIHCAFCKRTFTINSTSLVDDRKPGDLLRLRKPNYISIITTGIILFTVLFFIFSIVNIIDNTVHDNRAKLLKADQSHHYTVGKVYSCNIEPIREDGSTDENRVWLDCEITSKDSRRGYYYVKHMNPPTNKPVISRENALDMKEKS